jgi:hypothetical protein
MSTNDQIAELVDVALQLKQQIESKDLQKLSRLFEPEAKINVFGRFYSWKTFYANLNKLLAEIEQPGLDIISVDESELKEANAFIAVTLEIFWVNQKTWEESILPVTLALELVKNAKRNSGWIISGFTIARAKRIVEKEEVPIVTSDNSKTGGSGSFLDGLFNFWY